MTVFKKPWSVHFFGTRHRNEGAQIVLTDTAHHQPNQSISNVFLFDTISESSEHVDHHLLHHGPMTNVSLNDGVGRGHSDGEQTYFAG